MNLLQKKGNITKNAQMLFLLVTGCVTFLFVLLDHLYPGLGYFLSEKTLAVPCLLFFGSALTPRLSTTAKVSLVLSAIAVLCFAVVQMQHHLSQIGTGSFGVFAVAYLLAFPFATVVEESGENVGLKWIGRIYVAGALMVTLFAGMLLMDAVPEALTSGIYWDGARLAALWHPNICACVFMLGIGFVLYFLVQSEQKWKKISMAVLEFILFCGMALTNSRTAILMTCALFGGTLFFMVWHGGWKRFLLGVTAAVVVIAAMFFYAGMVFDLQTELQINKLLLQEAATEETSDSQMLWIDEESGETYLAGQSNQGSLAEDMWTLNGRTYIWKAAFTALRDNPSLKIWGTEYVSAEISSRNYFSVGHAHNSWIQTLMKLGCSGLLVALVYTGIALWNAVVLLWRKDTGLEKKVVAMIVLCMLAAGFLEPYLFVGDVTTLFMNFAFFLCTGYLIHWVRGLSGKETAKA